jgi:hypothetical protein
MDRINCQQPETGERMDVVAFQQTWIGASNLKEKTASQSHFNDLYNQRPTWLQNAHAALDRAVWDAYGWPEDEVPGEVEEDVILSRLLARSCGR